MIWSLLTLILGIIILIKGADFFVEGSSSLALKFKIPPIIIGLTIVSLGTGAPELAVSLISAIQGSSGLSISSIFGSNLFNTLIVLGVCTFIYPVTFKSNTVWKEIPFSILAVFVLIFLALTGQGDKFNLLDNPNMIIGSIDKYAGFILLSMLLIFLYYIFGEAVTSKKDNLKKEAKDEYIKMPLYKISLLISVGIVGLIFGGQLTVKSALELGTILDINQNLVGLLMVSVGTSLPELFTSISAAKKKEFDLVIGNIIGSNIINIFLVIGVTSIFKTIDFNLSNLYSAVFLAIVSCVLLGSMFFSKKFKVTWKEGVILISLYVIYMIMNILI